MQKLASKPKIYRILLVEADNDFFGNKVSSNKWDGVLKAIDNDLHKVSQFRFVHLKDGTKVYTRHYENCPANGNVVMRLGQFKTAADFACVRITLNSQRYKKPYLILDSYAQTYLNPDRLAEVFARGLNVELAKQGLKVVLEPWDTGDEVAPWLIDCFESYQHELKCCPGVVHLGYEDALEAHELKQAKKDMPPKTKVIKKSDEICHFILYKDKELLLEALKKEVEGLCSPKDIARPLRFLQDCKATDRINYGAFRKQFPEKVKLISESRYNHFMNPANDEYRGDKRYERLRDVFDFIFNNLPLMT